MTPARAESCVGIRFPGGISSRACPGGEIAMSSYHLLYAIRRVLRAYTSVMEGHLVASVIILLSLCLPTVLETLRHMDSPVTLPCSTVGSHSPTISRTQANGCPVGQLKTSTLLRLRLFDSPLGRYVETCPQNTKPHKKLHWTPGLSCLFSQLLVVCHAGGQLPVYSTIFSTTQHFEKLEHRFEFHFLHVGRRFAPARATLGHSALWRPSPC